MTQKIVATWLDTAFDSLLLTLSVWFHAFQSTVQALPAKYLGYGLFLLLLSLIYITALAIKIKQSLKPGVLGQFLKFAAIGALGTACHYLLLIVMVSKFGQPPVLSTSCGALLGAFVNYVLNRTVTFKSARKHREALPRFVLLAAIGMIFNGLIMAGLVQLGVYYLLAQVCATGFILIFNYLVSRVWIFH